MFEKGCTLEEIRKFLGHKDVNTTQGYIYSLRHDDDYAILVGTSLAGNELKL